MQENAPLLQIKNHPKDETKVYEYISTQFISNKRTFTSRAGLFVMAHSHKKAKAPRLSISILGQTPRSLI